MLGSSAGALVYIATISHILLLAANTSKHARALSNAVVHVASACHLPTVALAAKKTNRIQASRNTAVLQQAVQH
eukprot:17621-Heterococcus_DN1.PRE.1